MPCDVLVPAAIGNVITAENADQLQCKSVVEAANGPTTPEGDQKLRTRGIVVLPDIYTNGGSCSGLIYVYSLDKGSDISYQYGSWLDDWPSLWCMCLMLAYHLTYHLCCYETKAQVYGGCHAVHLQACAEQHKGGYQPLWHQCICCLSGRSHAYQAEQHWHQPC